MPHKRGGRRAADRAAEALSDLTGQHWTRKDLPLPGAGLGPGETGDKEMRRRAQYLALIADAMEYGTPQREYMYQARGSQHGQDPEWRGRGRNDGARSSNWQGDDDDPHGGDHALRGTRGAHNWDVEDPWDEEDEQP